jgi:hypothetical protein
MAITSDLQVWETQNPESFGSLHWMGYHLADGRVLIDLTGIVLLGLRGDSNWVRKTLLVGVNGGKVEPLLSLGPAQEGHHWELQPVMWSVSAAPASIFDANTAVNAGWAVDTCNTGWDLGDQASSGNLLEPFPLYLNLAVSDTDGILCRITYDFRAVGNLRQMPDVFVQ